MRTPTLLLFLTLAFSAAADVSILSVTPKDGATNVDPESAVQLHIPEPLNRSTLTAKNVRLLAPEDKVVPAMLQTDLGGVITLSPDDPLLPSTTYRVELAANLKTSDNQPFTPFSATFTTGPAKPTTDHDRAFHFTRTKLADIQGATRVLLGPDHRLYVSTWEGRLLRYEIDPNTGQTGSSETVLTLPGRRILGMTFEPNTPARNPTLWLAHDANAGKSTTPQDTSGQITRIDSEREAVHPTITPVITGLLSAAHALNQIAFGPDGRLYISQGSTTHLGGKASEDWHETPTSAAILVADVNRKGFSLAQLPVNVDTAPPTNYDPTHPEARVKLHATGIREAYGLCWHSNGHLYTAVNMNDTTARTPARPGLPAFNVQPDEQLLLIKPGKYYGHPNPARNQFILLGGNPTAGKDPWEIPNYPVGTKPDKDFEPALLLYNLVPIGGQSADGLAEYTAPGPLQGALLACFYTTARTVHAFRLSPDGTKVLDARPLRDETGRRLKFPSPIDLTINPATGQIYVIDFADPRRTDSGGQGAIWLLTPAPR